ncbi:isocitrate lyase/PEP mutase family protein [Novosphingobium sp. G106]|uniref:isocitrate lyase/PEP mutase family protein n=1 Tax=Novosphingobium sp. G106 TaxID=2849500 RepID=UPI001C2DE5B2|nr:isocitrate lyase/PEP mutase family protein [Novosphingobium sp. G106]MBV1688583.1 isocitrate lyase/PEP mutase family protein [Novosphingobium sp. G106]
MSAGKRFRALIDRTGCLVTPGVYDALSARIAEQVGFEALAISGFGVEAALLGKPDVGLLTLSELVGQARRIAGVVDVPVTCDGETGFGGVHNIARLVREMEDCGIAAIQLEDQHGPKRCPALDGRSVVSLEEQLARLGAALAARRDPDFVVIARSDADLLGIDELILRCNRYLAAGADIAMPICFVVDGRPISELTPDDQMEVYARLAREIDGPVKGVLIPAGYAASDMAAIGYKVMGLTGGPIEAAVNALHRSLAELHRSGTEAAYRAANPPKIAAPGGIMKLLGIDALLDFEARFQGSSK